MSVKRYNYGFGLLFETEGDGMYVLHSDYADLLSRHNALVGAVAKMLLTDDALYDAQQNGDASDEYEIRAKAYASARAEVDRLLEEEKP